MIVDLIMSWMSLCMLGIILWLTFSGYKVFALFIPPLIGACYLWISTLWER
jgi:hypothetical protein